MVAQGHLPARPLEEVVSDRLQLLDPSVSPRRFELHRLSKEAHPLLVVVAAPNSGRKCRLSLAGTGIWVNNSTVAMD